MVRTFLINYIKNTYCNSRHISINGFDYISQNGNINDKITLINNALNVIFRHYIINLILISYYL